MIAAVPKARRTAERPGHPHRGPYPFAATHRPGAKKLAPPLNEDPA
ncbi:hypothetical protein NKH77_23380 [Streptomyces sp. M19]